MVISFKIPNLSYLKSIILIIILFLLNNKNNIKQSKILRSKQVISFTYQKKSCMIYKKFQCIRCNIGYDLIKGECVPNYSIRAVYNSSSNNTKVKLFNKLYEKYIEKLIIDNEIKEPNSEFFFPDSRLHEIMLLFNNKIMYSTSYMFFNITDLIFFELNKNTRNNYIKNMRKMFQNCRNLKTVNFRNNVYKNVYDLSYMFDNCDSLNSLELPIFSSSKTENISYMFANCSSLKLLEFSYINSINIKDMSGLFYGCSSLSSINLTGFNPQNLKNISYMFAGCSSLKSVNIENFQMDNIKNMNFMFLNCSNLEWVKLPYLSRNQIRIVKNLFIGCNQLSFSNLKREKTKKEKSNDVCIVGPWYGRNYGSMLTYYALHEVVKNMGYNILMVNDPLETYNIIYNKIYPKSMMSYLYNVSQNKNLKQLYELNEECKCFLTGSDQLWNVYLSRPLKQFYFLGFVDNINKKLSYATSFGIEYQGTEKEKVITKSNLQRFDGISVRDELSLNITKEIFGIKNVVKVCDPTFLCNISDYLKLANKVHMNNSEKFLLAYILDPNPEIGDRLEKLSVDKNIKVIIILDYPPDIWEKNKELLFLKGRGNVELKATVEVNEWLWLYNNSKAVFTDSFHGTIFSIIFKKPFITLRNIRRGGERFFSLLNPLKLKNRLFETPECINSNYELFDKIDYSTPLEKLNEIKEESYKWLNNKLGSLIT